MTIGLLHTVTLVFCILFDCFAVLAVNFGPIIRPCTWYFGYRERAETARGYPCRLSAGVIGIIIIDVPDKIPTVDIFGSGAVKYTSTHAICILQSTAIFKLASGIESDLYCSLSPKARSSTDTDVWCHEHRNFSCDKCHHRG